MLLVLVEMIYKAILAHQGYHLRQGLETKIMHIEETAYSNEAVISGA